MLCFSNLACKAILCALYIAENVLRKQQITKENIAQAHSQLSPRLDCLVAYESSYDNMAS